MTEQKNIEEILYRRKAELEREISTLQVGRKSPHIDMITFIIAFFANEIIESIVKTVANIPNSMKSMNPWKILNGKDLIWQLICVLMCYSLILIVCTVMKGNKLDEIDIHSEYRIDMAEFEIQIIKQCMESIAEM